MLFDQCLTCDIYINRGLFSGSVLVPAAEQAGVQGLCAADRHTAAVMLACLPTARFLHLHLISGQACWERPRQLPATPGQQVQEC